MEIYELTKIINGKYNGKNKSITGFSIDTRTIKKGDAFIALKGKKYDGNIFIKEALKKGASIIITDQKLDNFIYVKDTFETLSLLGSYYRNKYNIPLIAVTGSVGKTTLKELISSILTPTYNVLKSEGNQNNHIGLPLTLFKLNENIDAIVTELGMNHLNEINKLSCMCKPNISLITNIGTSHIGNLKSKKNIFKAKMEILNGMNEGILIVNGKDKYLKKIKSKNNIKCLKCGKEIKNVKVTLDKTIFTYIYDNKKYKITFNYPGKHYPILIAMAIKVGLSMGISIEDCIERLESVKLPNNRLNKIELKSNITLIDDSYNANYESFINALELIKKDKRNKLLIIGDILELGSFSDKIHLKLIKKINHLKNTEVWLTGSEFKKLQNKVHYGTYFNNLEEIKEAIKENNWGKSIILVKGSNANKLKEASEEIILKYK